VKTRQPSGGLKRGLRISRLGLSLTGSYLGYQLQNLFLGEDGRADRRKKLHRRVSRRVREELETLKGPFMKIGQLLSMQTHALPEETIEELARLQMRAPAMHPTLARAQFRASLGKEPEEVFREFDAEPFAAASLGQVHRAVTKDGARVAVKIQYPAIRTAIENDFKLLRSAAWPGRVSGHFPVSIIDETRRGFLEEVDYCREAANIEFFQKALACFSYLHLPKVHRDLSTDRVLTMSYVDGFSLGDFLGRQPEPAVRNLIGFRLLELYLHQVHVVHSLHADPHPGNYLFRDDGSIGLVDFGCVKRLPREIPELARCFVERVWLRGEQQTQRMQGLIWGPADYSEDRRARALFKHLTDFYSTVYPPPEANRPVVDFGKTHVLSKLTDAMRKALRHKLTNPEYAFSGRTELGLYSLLHQLKARVDTAEVLRQLRSGQS
jgi:predicted unusual protein kinase regulating ubiquinone biosynthesis (AarF/ABC1/UbiB family)